MREDEEDGSGSGRDAKKKKGDGDGDDDGEDGRGEGGEGMDEEESDKTYVDYLIDLGFISPSSYYPHHILILSSYSVHIHQGASSHPLLTSPSSTSSPL